MIPKLTDDAISRLPLQAGRAELLEEIMSTVAPERQLPESTPLPRDRSKARWLVPLAVAATVASLASTPLWWGGGGHGERPVVSYHSAVDSPATGYRAVLDAPGWKVDHTEADSKYGGEIGYRKGSQELVITWYPDDTYQGYLVDRQHITSGTVSDPGTPVTILGGTGHLWAYSDDDHTVMREPDDGHWMEVRGSGMGLAAYQALLGQLRLVSLAEYESTLPSSFVTAADRPAAVEKILDGIEQVTGVTVPAGTTLDTSSDEQDPYQLGADIAGQYACAWISEFAAAQAAGDQPRADEAARVMATSRSWPILQKMNPDGDYPETVWEYADDLGAGHVPEGYAGGLGCGD